MPTDLGEKAAALPACQIEALASAGRGYGQNLVGCRRAGRSRGRAVRTWRLFDRVRSALLGAGLAEAGWGGRGPGFHVKAAGESVELSWRSLDANSVYVPLLAAGLDVARTGRDSARVAPRVSLRRRLPPPPVRSDRVARVASAAVQLAAALWFAALTAYALGPPGGVTP